jgi:hypothetical protein
MIALAGDAIAQRLHMKSRVARATFANHPCRPLHNKKSRPPSSEESRPDSKPEQT